ncbi:ATP-binding protein [Halolamina litorea]|uniref:PAS domain-containing sensor histidine kinase n=1 Tax=Halolamina litorea TaxID=1515593 RepID=UPI002270E376|nr:PAS domain-containing sensor histidine kinase [Halolamina litorea]
MHSTSRRGRWLRGGAISLLGMLALALPAADLAPTVPDPWGPETLAGSLAVSSIAMSLLVGGAWLATREWETDHLNSVVVQTYGVTVAAAVLAGWATALWSTGDPTQYVIAIDGVLIAGLLAFATAVLNVEKERRSEAARRDETAHRELAMEVIDSSTVATIVVDADGRIAWLNAAAAETFDIDHESAVGRGRDAVLGEVLTPAQRIPDADDPAYRVRTAGEPQWVERSRHRIEDGLHAGGWIEEYPDVTEKREAFDALEGLARLPRETEDPDPVGRILDAGREYLDADYAAVTRLDGDRSIETVRSDTVDPTAGDAVPDLHIRSVEDVVDAGGLQTGSSDGPAGSDAVTGGFEFDHGAGSSFQTYVAAPVVVDVTERSSAGNQNAPRSGDADTVAVLTFLDRVGTPATAWERALTELLAAWVGYELGSDRRELAHERERLEFVNRVVRHNLLNGLNLVNARIEHLDAGVDGPEAEEHLSVIRSRVDEMTDLIDTIRAFMDAALHDRPLEPVPIRATLSEQLTRASKRYDATFDVHDLPDADLHVTADDVLGEVIGNVLENAVEHSDGEPEVEVWTTRASQRLPSDGVRDRRRTPAALSDGGRRESQRTLTIHVADDGPGIPDDQKRELLTAGEANLSDPGNGFGFYLVHEMMASYGGEVRIRDNDPHGTVVDLVFPVSEQPTP